MHVGKEPTIEELRRESEVSRAALNNTVGALREKLSGTTDEVKALLSPAHVTEEVKEYVRDTKERLYYSVEQKIRRNPLQAAALGAVAAYPLWTLARRMPAPLMLLGAGFLLAHHEIGVLSLSPSSTAPGAVRPPHVKDAPSIVNDLTQKASETFQEATETFRDTAQAAADSIAQATETASGSIRDAANSAQSYAADTAERSRATIADLFNKNPMAVAGIAAVAGALLAALVPNSRIENQVLGPSKEQLKDKAFDVAGRGMENLKDTADRAVQHVGDALQREGLSPDGAKETLSDLTRRAASVAERGLESLTEKTMPENQPASRAES